MRAGDVSSWIQTRLAQARSTLWRGSRYVLEGKGCETSDKNQLATCSERPAGQWTAGSRRSEVVGASDP